MSKFPNHGLFARTAAASTRSSSIIAHASRRAPRRRSAAITPLASLLLPSSSTASSSSASTNISASQPSSSQTPFIGPLTLAASQNASAQQTPSNTDTRNDTTASSSNPYNHHDLDQRCAPESYAEHALNSTRASDSQSRAFVHLLESDLTFAASTLALADVPFSTSAHSHLFASPNTPSATFSAAARHLARAQASAFPLPSLDRASPHPNASAYSLPHARGVHIFYPNAAASHALSSVTSSSLESPYNLSGLNGRSLPPSKRSFQRSRDASRQPADYVPLWNASTAPGPSTYSRTTQQSDSALLEERLENLALLPHDASSSDLLRNPAFDVPTNLLASGPLPSDFRSNNPLDHVDHASATSYRHTASAVSHQAFADFGRGPSHSTCDSHSDAYFSSHPGTVNWTDNDNRSSARQSSSSSSSKSSSSSSSSKSSRSPTPTISARPHLATSSAKQDSSGSHGSGSSTPTSNKGLSPYQIENALLGPTSLLTTATHAARANYDQRRRAAAAALTETSEAANQPPLWTASLSSPKHRKLHYAFQHGAYGIPKRHPWAAVRGNGNRVQPTPAKPLARSGAVGMLAAAADFLTGSAGPSAPSAPKAKLGGEALVAEDGRRLGLNSPIREHGRVVQDRLQSVQVGEDAYFLRSDSIGVADGVGGWASRAGADPALFSRLLMHFCAAELSKFDDLSADELVAHGGKKLKEWEQLDPVEVMHIAWERCVRASRREGILGSSTALLAVLRGDELRIANLGDCVLLIIRAGELLFRSTEQQHSFNFPVQLGMMGHTAESVTIAANRTLARDGFLQSGASDDLDDNAPNPLGTTTPASMDEARKGKPNISPAVDGDEAEEAEWDEPRRDAGRWSVKVQKGDIIVVGSDGLVDNLFDEDIVEEVLKFAPPPVSQVSIPEDDKVSLEDGNRIIEGEEDYRLPDDFDPQLVSEALCSRAKAVSEDSRAVSSPFQQRAMEEGLHYVGGKHDDISVVVAVVGDPSERLTKAGYSVGSEQGGPIGSDLGRGGAGQVPV
ncbi:uncharacterized protein UHO2_00003 [Ustilago hordei]|uniref:PPM-type phosphatase domain-containing protein n=1 Tax=Ustilago hordei TaxID=120017 RepID=I2FXC8_USTHO|nr:uncharacterized protein UHO2_00003 [Ustilago hordei]CCF51571.1 uncharacterized protein UHOR_08278 [Ustilago hordei]SYW81479.1 uncharacterized protein UHO2_00003 [Ustilago hordei]